MKNIAVSGRVVQGIDRLRLDLTFQILKYISYTL